MKDGLTPYIRRPGLNEEEEESIGSKIKRAVSKKKVSQKIAPTSGGYKVPQGGFGMKELMKSDQGIKSGTDVIKGIKSSTAAASISPVAHTGGSLVTKLGPNKLVSGKTGFFNSKISKGMKGAGTAASMGMAALGIGGENDHSDVGNTASGAMDGFNAGMMTGNPYVAVGGAIVGGLAGLSGAGAKRSEAKAKAKAKAEAQHQNKMVSIEAEKGQKIQGALTRMGAAFSKNLKGKDKIELLEIQNE